MIQLHGKTYLTPAEAGTHINKAQQTVYQNWKRWGWEPYHFGTSLLFSKSNIDNWLSKQLKPGTPPNPQRTQKHAV